MRAAYGEGNVYRRGRRWWIRYPGLVDGRSREIREPAGRNATEAEARAFLRRRIREVEAAKDGLRGFVGPASRRLTVREVVEDHIAGLAAKGIRSFRTVEAHAKPLLEVLGHVRIVTMREDTVRQYVSTRRAQERADATIERELEVLRGALNRARRSGRILVLPEVPVLVRRHANARQGFLEPEEFFRLLGALEDEDFRDFLEFAWWTAMRPGEIASLRWDEYDERAASIRLRPQDAKIGRARVVPVVGPVAALLKRRTAARRPGIPWIFHVDGSKAVRDTGGLLDRLYDHWRRALRAVDLPIGLIPYDLRRSALRNTLKAGAKEKAAMELGGWLTRSTMDRYNIVTDRDLAEAILAAGERASGAAIPDKTRTNGEKRKA